jgi:PST family polysaccharide transporter
MLASIALSAIALFVFWNLYGFGWKFQLLGILLIANITNAFEVYERWFQHKSLNQLLVRWRVYCFMVFAALKLIAAVYFESFFILICIFAVEVIVKNYGYKVLYVHVKKQTEKGEYDTKLFSEIFSQTKYLIFSGVASVVYLKIDILMLESMVDSQEAGIYAVASRISEIWYIFPQVVLIALFPKLLEIAKTSNEKYLRLLQLGFDLLFVIALSLSAFIFAVSPYLIELLYGEQYRASSLILQVHIFASVFIYMRVLLSQWLVSEQFAQFSLFSQISGAVSNILLNLWLIPIYGAMGAAIATLISYAITAYVCLLFHNRTHKIALMMTKSFLFPFRIFHIYRNIKQIMS